MANDAATVDCPRCRRGRETYWYMGLWEYDVDRARELVRDGREPVELEEDSARGSVELSELDERHVPHVDPAVPGVIAHVLYRDDAGREHRGHVLIDGHHRAARCLREQRPFRAYLLTEEESLAVLLRGPDDPFPRARAVPRHEQGRCLLTHPDTGATCELDEREAFLWRQFDGRQTAGDIRAAYAARFGTPLSQEDFNDFARSAQSRGLLADIT